jgi:ABC-type methionine transport system ATPase subunit
MLVLDDVFSALDLKTSQEILDRLLGPAGVLRVLGITVVMTTHSRE